MNPNPQDTVETKRDELEPPPEVETSDAPSEADQPEGKTDTKPTGDATTSDERSGEDKDKPKDEKASSDGKPEDKPKPRKKAQARIDQLTFERRRAEAEAKYWRDRAMQAETPTNGARQPEKAAPAEKPREEDFDSHDDYIVALVDWRTGQADRKAEPAAQTTQPAKTPEPLAGELGAKWSVARSRGIEAHQDFDTVVQNPQLQISTTMVGTAVNGDIGDEVIYHLGKNLEEAARIAALDEVAQQREILKLEDKLKGQIESAIEADETGVDELEVEPANKIEDTPGNQEKVAAPTGGSAAQTSHPKRKVTSAPPASTPLGGGKETGPVDPGKFQSQADYETWRRKGGGQM